MAVKDDVVGKMTWQSLFMWHSWWHGWLWLKWQQCAEMADDMAGLINFALRVFPVAKSPVADDYGFFIVVAGGKCGRKCDCCRRRTIIVFYDVDLFLVKLDAANKELLLSPMMSIYSQSSWTWSMAGRPPILVLGCWH